MRFLFVGLLVFIFCFGNGDTVAKGNDSNTKSGFEIDALPYLSGGYYLSGWLGLQDQSLRIRPIFAKVNIPDFYLANEFEKNTVKVYALVFDYFIDDDFSGFWVAPGLEYWNGKIENRNSASSDYNEWIFTVGGGYVWKFWGNLYLNPWIAGHVHLAGETNIKVENDNFKPALFTPEISLKIGWHF